MSRLRDRLNYGWHTAKRQHIPKAIAWWQRTYPELFLPSGWALITLSAFGRSPRAWEASIGLFLVLSAAVRVVVAYAQAKVAARIRNAQRD